MDNEGFWINHERDRRQENLYTYEITQEHSEMEHYQQHSYNLYLKAVSEPHAAKFYWWSKPLQSGDRVAATATGYLEQAHAHNDYEHERPLYYALDHGFTSVEADVWLVFGNLFVAHDAHELVMGRTLESLYLDPLQERIEENGSSVYLDGSNLTLLIDIKTDGEATYEALHEVFADHDAILTTYRDGQVEEGPVTAIISGDRPRELMEAQEVRYAGYDGRMEDLGTDAPASFIPLISDNWTNLFTWIGEGAMPEAERRELERIVKTAHENGQRVRFWATPDEPGRARENLWRVLAEVGVDYINTDDLAGLEAFLPKNEEAAGTH